MSYERDEMIEMGSVKIMGRVGNFASENGSGCSMVFIMEEYPKMEVHNKGGVCVFCVEELVFESGFAI